MPGHIACFRRGGLNAGLRVLVIQQLAKGSQVVYYNGSHQHDLPTQSGPRGLFETPESALKAVGCKASEKNFLEGGL
jgi:hypothetical protein